MKKQKSAESNKKKPSTADNKKKTAKSKKLSKDKMKSIVGGGNAFIPTGHHNKLV